MSNYFPMQGRKEAIDTLTDGFSSAEYLGREIAAAQYRLAYNYEEKLEPELFNEWLRDLKNIQRRITEAIAALERGEH